MSAALYQFIGALSTAGFVVVGVAVAVIFLIVIAGFVGMVIEERR